MIVSVLEFANGLSSGLESVSVAETFERTDFVLVDAYTVVSGNALQLAVCPDCDTLTVFVPSTTSSVASDAIATPFQVHANDASPDTVPDTETVLFPALCVPSTVSK